MFSFAPLQGETAKAQFHGTPQEKMYSSFWLLDEDGLHRASTAVLRVCKRLPGWPRALALLLVVPRPVRDWAYKLVAKYRYRVWGRSESCRIPTPEERPYFLP